MRFRKVSGVLILRWNIFRYFGNFRKSSENRQNSSEVAGKIQIMTRKKSDAFDSSEKVCKYRTFMSISWKRHGVENSDIRDRWNYDNANLFWNCDVDEDKRK